MSEQKKFDDFIREEFNNYSPNVPPHIWERIADERKKRKPVVFWYSTNLIWLMALIVAGSIGTIVSISHYSISSKKNNANNNTTNSSIIIVADNNKNTDTNQSSSANKKDYNSGATSSTLQNYTNNNKLNNIDVKQFSSSLNSNNPIIKKKTVISGDRINIRAANNKKTNNSDIAYNNDAIQANTNLINNDPEDATNSVTITKNKWVNNNKNILLKNYQPIKLFGKVDMLSLDKGPAQVSLQQKNKTLANLPDCPTIEKEAAGNKKYFELYIAPDYGLRTLTDTSNSVYLQQRKSSTKFSSAFSAGVRYTRVFNNCMSVRIGLNYSQINEIFSYVQSNVVQTTYDIDPVTGDTTGSYTVRGTRYQTTYNHYRNIDIPLTIGYELGNGRFHANINAGIIANIYSWQKGDELDTNLQPVSITTGEGSSIYQFKTNIGLGATGGVSVYYKLTDQLHFLAEPYVRYNFQPMSNDNLTIRQKYTTIGLRLGLRFDLPNAGSTIKR